MPSTSVIERARSLHDLVASRAASAERAVAPDADVVRAMAEAGLFSICVPQSLGGAEADPLTTIAVIDAIAQADGAAGWVLMIGVETTGIGASHFLPDTARSVFASPDVVVCGALNPVGTATRTDGGFRIRGRWPFASGSQRADWFWGQCVVVDGEPGETIEALVRRDHYEVLETWNSPGLRGSGSHDVLVDDLFVPDSHITRTRSVRPTGTGNLSRVPFTSRLAYNKVGVATGIAHGAIGHFVALASERSPRLTGTLLRDRPRAQRAVADAEALLGGARGFCNDVIGEMWRIVVEGGRPSKRQQALVRLACSDAVKRCAEAVTGLYEASGTAMSDMDHPLARCFRDIHVVGQHIMVSPHAIDDAGRVLLGLDPLSLSF